MGYASSIGKYHLRRTIGEGTFAKVKLAVDTTNGHYVAVKVIDKNMVMESNLKYQVQREIRTMKLLHHPKIVRIHEVIGTKSKIYIVMEYVSGGRLSDKLSYVQKFGESDARKLFHQLIDAVDYCHDKGVYHRDLKPENLLIDSKGDLKVSDFGLSALKKPGGMLMTACGSPCYVAPDLLTSRGYDGAAADVWSCGVILFELLAGYLPFEDRNLMVLYRKIARADYSFPQWFTDDQKRLISRILEPNSKKRITIQEIIDDPWFQKDYVPTSGYEFSEKIQSDDVHTAFNSVEVEFVHAIDYNVYHHIILLNGSYSNQDDISETKMPKSPSFINAFQLIAMSHDLDLSGLFEEQDEKKQTTRLGSELNISDTIKKIEAAAVGASLTVERTTNNKMKIHHKQKLNRSTKSYFDLSAEVIEVAPMNCVVEISKSAGELRVYKNFCRSLSNLLAEHPTVSFQIKETEEHSNKCEEIRETL